MPFKDLKFDVKATQARLIKLNKVLPGKPASGKPFRAPTTGMILNWIEPGTVGMGLAKENKPVFQAKITRGFWMGRYEVTQQEWSELMPKQNPSRMTGSPYLPVECVTHEEALKFCEELTRKERAAGNVPDGCEYRLPTEAEWEYCARAGRAGHYELPATEGWTRLTSGWRLHEIGESEPNAWGLYDLHGNVFEWCLDAWHDYPKDPKTVQDDPFVAPKSWRERRIVKGGSWCNFDVLRSWDRLSHYNVPGGYRGFRVVLGPTLTDKIPEVARSPRGVTINLSNRDREGVATGQDNRPFPDGRGSLLSSKPPADWPQTGRAVPPEKETLQRDTWYDLLPLVDVERHAINGPWLRTPAGVHSVPASYSRLIVPLVIQGDYELAFSFTRYAGKEASWIYIPVGTDASTSFLLSGRNGQASGFKSLRGIELLEQKPASSVRRPGQLENGLRYHCLTRVTTKEESASIAVTLNGEPYFSWTGPRTDLLTTPLASNVALPRRDLLAIGFYEIPATYHELQLRLLTGTAQRWTSDMPSAAPQPPESIAGQCVRWKESGKPYWISPKTMNFTEAVQLAHQYQARLLRVSSQAERNFLLNQWPDRPIWLSAWRNGQEPDARIGWLDEKLLPLRYFPPWAEQEPSSFARDFSLMLSAKTHLLQDHDSGNAFHAVLEWGEEE